MKNKAHIPLIRSILKESGLVVKNRPSLEYPIPVALFYRYKSDGTVCSLWPKGNISAETSWISRRSPEDNRAPYLHRMFFALGMESLLANGRHVLYADLPTATYLQKQWRRN